MAVEAANTCLSWEAAIDLTSFQFYPVALTAAGRITTIGSTATKPIGVLQDTPAAGVFGSVCIAGPSKMVAYTGAVAPSDSLGVSAAGVGEVTTTDNRWVIADYLGADGNFADAGVNTIISVNIKTPTRY